MSTTRLPEVKPVALTDEDRDAVFNALPDRLPGFMKLWGWLHFAKDIEAKVHEKNADQLHAYGLAVWKEAIQAAANVCQHQAAQAARDGEHHACDSAKLCELTIRSLPDPSVIQQARRR